MPAFSDRLLDWWDLHGRKDLPWQHPRTPYRVWISEIMLQQTQVATVIPYFERWMQTFPDIETLASAPVDEVMSLWSGLGYYARARNLHKAAIQCVEHHNGQLPATSGALNALPGIGHSTANAIVSLSTGEPAVILDGNVRRLLARHAAVEGWTAKAAVQTSLWDEAQKRLPNSRGDDYTQAIMDLGAMLCTRTNPACGQCPVAGDCRALRNGQVEKLPSPKPRTKVSDQTIHMLIIRDARGRVLLEKRPPAGIWGGLWCLPSGDNHDSIEASLGIKLTSHTALPRFEHRLSHVRMTILPSLAAVSDAGQVKCSGHREWFASEQQESLGLPKPVSDLLNELIHGELE